MVLYKKNKKWIPIHISLDLKKLDDMISQVEHHIQTKMDKTHLTRQWKTIDIMDVQIISATFQPSRDTTFVDVLVFVADLTGEQL